jgi:hypothetical protein
MSYYGNQKWSGKMKLCNVASYVAEALDVPEAALDIKFKWPSTKSGKVETVTEIELQKGEVDVTDLRSVWRSA